MRIGGVRVQFPCAQSDFEIMQIFVGHSNYLPGNGILRDVTRKPRRRQPPPARRREKIWGSSALCKGYGSRGCWAYTPSDPPRRGRRHHSCTSYIEKPRFSVPILTYFVSPFSRVTRYALRVSHCAVRTRTPYPATRNPKPWSSSFGI